MSLWRNVRGEMAGAWRSICYDLGRRPAERDPGPDVTSTGLNTFPGSLVDLPAGPPETDARPPRRFVAVTAFCALAACGAAGSYIVATTAFAGRMSDTTVAAAAPPGGHEAQDEAIRGGMAGMGRVPQTPGRQRAVPTPTVTATSGAVGVAVPPQATATRSAARAGTGRTAGGTTKPVTVDPECHCETPPVPTPTAPSDPSASASVSASPAASDSPSPSTSESLSPAPDGIAPSADSDRHHRRHRR
ncbi:hypothetical protein QLQ12_05020 [Actinoplanes sp. NEAU-A12]|uniref:Uncharacterized protein n=1 Tax=Actinoplanes sandaracinus TaxID=3045177 RepID=A0ABT6WE00_9ACTN|nr:hypothetical protein [Actinoplanes sandaracinus]MDI6097961.1 hypothetical protein [Actinoplanes sandaracinus]